MSENLLLVGRATARMLRSLQDLGLKGRLDALEGLLNVQVLAERAAHGDVLLPMTAGDAFEIARLGFVKQLAWQAADPAIGWDRALVRKRLADRGLASQRWTVADDERASRAAAKELPLPIAVSPVVPTFPGMARRVEDLADLSLATRVVRSYAADGRLLFESDREAVCLDILGTVIDGRYKMLMAIEQHPAKHPSSFPIALSGPAHISREQECLVAEAVAALEIRQAVVRATLRNAGVAWQLADVDLCPSPDWMPEDLAAHGGGTGFWELHGRIALGETPSLVVPQRGASLAWLSSRSGQVSRVPADAVLPHGCRLTCGVRVGDIIGHVLDVVSRNRLGYLVTTGDTAAQAAREAFDCRSKLAIETRAVMEAGS